MDQKSMVHSQNGILHSRKEEVALTLRDSMDGTGEHYAKWNKPGGEYHMISPINGTQSTKQTSKQNITRDTEIKNKLTVSSLLITGYLPEGKWEGKGERVVK